MSSSSLSIIRNRILYNSIITLVVVMGFVLVGCKQEKRIKIGAVEDRSQTPVLEVHGVSTLISDSGITRYRIEAETWKIYDKAEPSYWEFPRGIYLEKFNEDMMVEASLRADYAVYKEVEQIWHLVGNVHALNEEQEQFDTPEMFWNQKTERVYSDSTIVITREASIIQGVGFESNQSMTNYVILHPTGFFPIEE